MAYLYFPESLTEAAKIDGAGHMRILFSVVAPLSKAGIATLTMFYGVARWNEYYRSGIYISSISDVPLQVILRKFVVDGDVVGDGPDGVGGGLGHLLAHGGLEGLHKAPVEVGVL